MPDQDDFRAMLHKRIEDAIAESWETDWIFDSEEGGSHPEIRFSPELAVTNIMNALDDAGIFARREDERPRGQG